MSPAKDLRERLLAASNRETRHNYDVGDYWNLCEESANALEWHEARRTYHSTLTLMEHERVKAELASAELSRDEWKAKAEKMEEALREIVRQTDSDGTDMDEDNGRRASSVLASLGLASGKERG